jgi:16S rRNA (guanine966-N2)-methyltransferase
MTRIVAGVHGGRRLSTPDGRTTRPTSDRVREALFNTLDTLVELDGARFADLFAGSGAVGLEAASRGASHVLLVESDPRAARVVRSNITALGLGAVVTLRTAKVEHVVAAPPGGPYDVLFADPPYAVATTEVSALLNALRDGGWLAPEAVVVVERAARDGDLTWPDGFTADRDRRYGETALWYGRAL